MLARSAHAIVASALGLAACADEPPAECQDLSFATVAAPFLVSWCRGCHGVTLPPEERQRAPIDVTFESRADVVRWAPRLRLRVVDTETMPPAGGPSAPERALFARYLACGAPE